LHLTVFATRATPRMRACRGPSPAVYGSMTGFLRLMKDANDDTRMATLTAIASCGRACANDAERRPVRAPLPDAEPSLDEWFR
jgi:hypothetical protein